MSETKDKLAQLNTRLKHLENYEAAFKREIADLRREIDLLDSRSNAVEAKKEKPVTQEPTRKPLPGKEYIKSDVPNIAEPKRQKKKSPPNVTDRQNKKPKTETMFESAEANLERFIGENLISKIGIVILIIGVGIGAKYAIDNNLISPLMRILFGYAVGLILIGLAVKLKAKYLDYSAVLISGGMAIMYFITYFAYNFYALISQTTAFALMVIFTVFSVLVSIIYNRQVIAHIGLVGAYAVPFLLSNDSGRYAVLFGYVAIINIGILVVSVKKYWKSLFFSSFIFTWIIYSAWYFEKYAYAEYFNLALTFLSLFFAIFYLTFITYKLVNKEEFNYENNLLILINSFIFYGFGYVILNNSDWSNYLGLFTVLNALIHFVVGAVIYQLKLKDSSAFYLCVGLVLTFLTIAIPVQFDGHWVTLLLMAEAVFLFVIGRVEKIPMFEYFSYPLMAFAGNSLFAQWQMAAMDYPTELSKTLYPFLNKNFLTNLLIAVGFGVILFVDRKRIYKPAAIEESTYKFIRFFIPAAFLLILYNLFRIEIGNYFYLQEIKTAILPAEGLAEYTDMIKDSSLQSFNFIWQLNYTMLFLTVLSFVNIQKFRNAVLGFINLALNYAALAVFLLPTLIILMYLNESYLDASETSRFEPSVYNILIRYMSYAFVAALIFAIYRYIKQEFIHKYFDKKYLLIIFDIGLYFLILVVLSSELINWSDIIYIDEVYRLGLTILFGLYAVFLIVLGIIQKKQHLRIFAIILFAITLLKLFVYDIAELGTISKTVVFVSVGILLLIASFLYTKYKNVMFEDEII